MYHRNIEQSLLAALADTPVVLLNGARQSGKSTLVQQIAETRWPARYVTLDDATVEAAVRSDPRGFLAGQTDPLIIDEVQRVTELFLPIKLMVDRDRRPGRFLLTGSANVLMQPRLAEALVGRMEILTLWPLSQGEINGVEEDFVDRILAEEFTLSNFKPKQLEIGRDELSRLILRGGFPEVIGREEVERRQAWYRSYVTTLLQRDVRDLSNIEGLTEFPRLLALLAARAGGLLNLSDVSRATTISQTTLKRYMTLLQTMYLVVLLPPWTANLGARLVKAPKLMLSDTGLLASLLGVDAQRIRDNSTLLGAMFENFVVMEIRKQISCSKKPAQMFHFRTHSGQEVDIVLEEASGKLAGIEIKASASVRADDFKGLRALRSLVGGKFRRGVVFYTGSEAVGFGEDLLALPVTTLWR
ncbi:MAG: ATP-binding protein [Blastocatellia bacterium]